MLICAGVKCRRRDESGFNALLRSSGYALPCRPIVAGSRSRYSGWHRSPEGLRALAAKNRAVSPKSDVRGTARHSIGGNSFSLLFWLHSLSGQDFPQSAALVENSFRKRQAAGLCGIVLINGDLLERPRKRVQGLPAVLRNDANRLIQAPPARKNAQQVHEYRAYASPAARSRIHPHLP